MSQTALHTLVGTALTDRLFCSKLLNGKRHTLLVEFDLTEEEKNIVQDIEAGSIQEFAARLDQWLQTQESTVGTANIRRPAAVGTGLYTYAVEEIWAQQR